MNKLNQCQYELINDTYSKEPTQEGLLDITYVCNKKKQGDKVYLNMLVDEENSTMHKKCIRDGMLLICGDCNYQSSERV